MKMIVGLGNPGAEYNFTRHNAGFLVLDLYAKRRDLTWAEKGKFRAAISEFRAGDEKVLLVKPLAYYNLTGEVVAGLLKFYKMEVVDLLVVCDDLNLEFGTIRTRHEGSDGGNNGLRSLAGVLGTEFKRVRIGIGGELRKQMGDAAFVLSRFSEREKEDLPRVVMTAEGLIDEFIAGEFETTTVE